MGKKYILAIVAFAAVSVACNIRPPGQAATPTAVVQPGPAPAPTQPPAAPTQVPAPTAAAPAPTQAPAPPPPTRASVVCDPMASTSLRTRPPAEVNGTRITLQVRDVNDCFRPLFYNETGIATGQNYRVNLPQGWTAVTASVTAEIHKEGGQAQQFRDTPVVVIRGPWQGGAGLFEGAIRIVPDEWVDRLLNEEVMPIQRQQTRKPGLQPITLQ